MPYNDEYLMDDLEGLSIVPSSQYGGSMQKDAENLIKEWEVGGLEYDEIIDKLMVEFSTDRGLAMDMYEDYIKTEFPDMEATVGDMEKEFYHLEDEGFTDSEIDEMLSDAYDLPKPQLRRALGEAKKRIALSKEMDKFYEDTLQDGVPEGEALKTLAIKYGVNPDSLNIREASEDFKKKSGMKIKEALKVYKENKKKLKEDIFDDGFEDDLNEPEEEGWGDPENDPYYNARNFIEPEELEESKKKVKEGLDPEAFAGEDLYGNPSDDVDEDDINDIILHAKSLIAGGMDEDEAIEQVLDLPTAQRTNPQEVADAIYQESTKSLKEFGPLAGPQRGSGGNYEDDPRAEGIDWPVEMNDDFFTGEDEYDDEEGDEARIKKAVREMSALKDKEPSKITESVYDDEVEGGFGIDDDGWNTDDLEGVVETLQTAADILYELENGRRGSYAISGPNLSDLVRDLMDLAHGLKNSAEVIEQYAEE
jgi:hypothetical protein